MKLIVVFDDGEVFENIDLEVELGYLPSFEIDNPHEPKLAFNLGETVIDSIKRAHHQYPNKK